jgi:uncharacterized protein (TIGR02996 family)
MPEEDGFLEAIKATPAAELPRLVYADWLEDRDDPRGDFIRLHWALRAAGPDHIDRVVGEEELSALRTGCGPDWLAVVEPEHVGPEDFTVRRECQCFKPKRGAIKRSIRYFHVELQDTECDAWKQLLESIEEAVTDGREYFAPLQAVSPSSRSQILTLPQTISKLKGVKLLDLYGSYLVRIPPEIGEMTSLEAFTPYTSYQLHWFPYELTRCPNLRDSTVSTRAIYGNNKHRPPFPRLDARAETAPGGIEPKRLPLKRRAANTTRPCSVCNREFEDLRLHRVWVSLRVATDVLPLLVNACSEECVSRLPTPPEGYVQTPHRGGLNVKQPPPR